MKGYLGIDNGTQGMSVIFTDTDLNVLATGEASYGFVEGLPEGCFEQRTNDWDDALRRAMQSVRRQLGAERLEILSIGISGQMHGEVLVGDGGEALAPVRLWCDARNEEEGHALTAAFGTKVPKRATAARFLWTTTNQPEKAAATRHITTPAGWTAYRLTGEFHLGIGDAAGMFPIDQDTLHYDKAKLKQFDEMVNNNKVLPMESILPKVRKAGEDAGRLNEAGAALLGLETGIPVASAEGDQVAALAGSLIGRTGMVSCCFGTSVCANSVGDRAFHGVSPAIDHFCAADGKPINMVWLRNGTTFLNTIVESYGGVLPNEKNAFAAVMPELIGAAFDCGGLMALPFMNDEPGLQVSQGGSALILGWTPANATAGNVAKAALLSTMFNLKIGSNVLDKQGYPRTEIVLTGGLTKTPECGQILADVFDCAVTLLASADEGCSWGAAVMAKYRHLCCSQAYHDDWATFLDSVATEGNKRRFSPNPDAVPIYKKMFERYRKLIELQSQLQEIAVS
jgi:L-ribulokinase